MKFKAVCFSGLNLRLWNPENNEETKPIPFCPMQKISRLQFEFVALMASLMSVVALDRCLIAGSGYWGDYWDYRSRG
jgi:hypothetical protein